MTGVTHCTLVLCPICQAVMLSASATKTRLTWVYPLASSQWLYDRPRKPDVYWGVLDVCLRPRNKIWTYWTLFTDVNTAVWTLSKTPLRTIISLDM